MPRLGPMKRKDLIAYFKQLGFDGPYSGGKHQLMVKALRPPLPDEQAQGALDLQGQLPADLYERHPRCRSAPLAARRFTASRRWLLRATSTMKMV